MIQNSLKHQILNLWPQGKYVSGLQITKLNLGYHSGRNAFSLIWIRASRFDIDSQNNMTVPVMSALGQEGIPASPTTGNGFPTMPARQINRQMSIDVLGVLRVENRNTSNQNPRAASIIHE